MIKQKQTNKNALIVAGFVAILALSIASTPVKGFGFVLGDRNEEQKIEEVEDRSDEKEESEDKDDQDEDEDEKEDENEVEKEEEMEIKSINVTKEGKTTKLNRQVELKNSGKSTIIKTKSSTGVEEEVQVEENIEDDGEVKTEIQVETKNKNDEFKVKVRTGSTGFTIEDGKFTAKTNYPLSINSETNELTITTPAGSKVVTVLPDQAIANMIRRGVLDIVDTGDDTTPSPSASPSTSPEPSSTPSASPSPKPAVAESEIEIVTTSQGEIAYKFSGGKLKKLLGLIPVRIDKNILVSADTGEVVSDQPAGILDAFFDVLSTN